MQKSILPIMCFFYASSLFASNLVIQPKSILLSHDQPKYDVIIYYPHIMSPLTPAQKQFNAAMKRWASNRFKEFRKSISDWNTEQLPASVKQNGSTLKVNYDLNTLNSSDLISIRFCSDSFYVGAAHPNHIYTSFTYDLVNNKPLSLAELFALNSNYLENIAHYAQEKVTANLSKEANGTVDVFKQGFAPNSRNYSVWNVTPSGLQFTFNEYQVAAYVFGPQQVTVPYTNISPYLAKNSVLANCLKSTNCKIQTIANKNPTDTSH